MSICIQPAVVFFLAAIAIACGGPTKKETRWGTASADSLSGTLSHDRISGGAGDDELRGFTGDDFLEGGTGDDRLFGGKGNDHLSGGPGNDRLTGGSGQDTLRGGPGSDQFVFDVGAAIDGAVDTIEDFEPKDGDSIIVNGIDTLEKPMEEGFRLQGGELQAFLHDLNRWVPVVRIGPMRLSIGELIRRKAVVPRFTMEF